MNNKPKMTFAEGVRISWQKELQLKNPWRILRLAFWTVWLSIYRLPFVLITRGRVLLVQLLNKIPGVHAEIKPRQKY